MAVVKLYNRKKTVIAMSLCALLLLMLIGRIGYIMIFCQEKYKSGAIEIHHRERRIKAPRGKILDRNGLILATNKTVCTISVIHSQIKEPKKVINVLAKELQMDKKQIEKKVKKVSSREKIKSNVDKTVGDTIRDYGLSGVKVDEDYRRTYPENMLASKVLGFTGADNQGIVGLEAKYDGILKGVDGKILTLTDAAGRELPGALESRKESVAGKDLQISIDKNVQEYAMQIANRARKEKQANYVSIIVMNPKNGEILAMVSVPEYNLNDPLTLNERTSEKKGSKAYMEMLNKMWRNPCINDTYEPGSTFKIITAAAGLEEKVVSINQSFFCPGYKIVEDRKIRCHKVQGHGSETFLQGVMNSCNPVFMTVGERIGVKRFYHYFEQFGLLRKTGIDLAGEAPIILHEQKNVGPVELATMSFGQSFQITPIALLRTVSAIINGGTLVTPHFAVKTVDAYTGEQKQFSYPSTTGAISKESCETMRYILEKVVSEGTGKKGYVEGFSVGGKTATSQKLPRGSGKYISSYIGFAPAEDPQVLAIAILDEPKGVYYGGTVAAPLIQELYTNILPYILE